MDVNDPGDDRMYVGRYRLMHFGKQMVYDWTLD